jgi:hypothetical protein
MANFNTEKTQAFINQASQVFNRYGYNSVFRHHCRITVLDEDYAKLGEIHCVSDPSEVPENIENEAIGYSDDGNFFWYLDSDLEDAIFEYEDDAEDYGDGHDLIRDLVSAADGPLKLEAIQLQLQIS